jgi:hypothetical protein
MQVGALKLTPTSYVLHPALSFLDLMLQDTCHTQPHLHSTEPLCAHPPQSSLLPCPPLAVSSPAQPLLSTSPLPNYSLIHPPPTPSSF